MNPPRSGGEETTRCPPRAVIAFSKLFSNAGSRSCCRNKWTGSPSGWTNTCVDVVVGGAELVEVEGPAPGVSRRSGKDLLEALCTIVV